MLAGLAFAFWRWLQIVTLIPTLGMLAYFVRGFTSSNYLTPNYILVLFITSVLAAFWAICTVVAYHRARHSAIFVSFIDFCFMAALIASVVVLRDIAKADCSNFSTSNPNFYVRLGPFGFWGSGAGSPWAVNINKSCAMLKACFAFGIMNIIFFFFTSILALFIHRKNRDKEYSKRETHTHRHGHRRSASRGSRHSHHRTYPRV
ncbi:MAG: hypothetical protein M1816_006162 [Peltula sp. TS41687]|nr:MAG: hypothetical protein M1816_006162 [Peltula sp. TS41687]